MDNMNNIYNGSIYGTNLYPLRRDAIRKLLNSHTVAIWNIYNIPRDTHDYIAANLGGIHLQTKIMCNKIKLYRRLRNNNTLPVALLSKKAEDDLRTKTGLNIRYLKNEAIQID